MKKIDRETFPFYRFDRLAACREINHFVSSGVKDISFLGNEEPGRVVANRRELGENAGFELDRLVVGNQVHGADITVVTAEDAGRGAYDNESRLPDTDALVTDGAGVCLRGPDSFRCMPDGADSRLRACAVVRSEVRGDCRHTCRVEGNGG